MARPRDWSVERVLLVVIAALVACLGAALWLTPKEQETFEYSGTCGRLRFCVRKAWIFNRCHLEPPSPTIGLKPFAPEGECEGDWHLLSESLEYFRPVGRFSDRYVERPLSAEPVPTILGLSRYSGMQQRARAAKGAYDAALDPLRVGSPPTSYRRMDCAGYVNSFSPEAFTVVLGTGPEAGPPTDCWTLTSEGELRHLLPRR